MQQPTTNTKHVSITTTPTANAMTPRCSTMLELVFELARVPELRACDLAPVAAAQIATGEVVLMGNYAHATTAWV